MRSVVQLPQGLKLRKSQLLHWLLADPNDRSSRGIYNGVARQQWNKAVYEAKV